MTEPTNDAVSDERLRELLPCPFCGGEPKMHHINFGYSSLNAGRDGYRVECTECSAMQPAYDLVEADARAAWNRRSVTSQASEGAGQHKWVKSNLGHGETVCEYCRITNREAAVLGELNACSKAPASPVSKRVERLETIEECASIVEAYDRQPFPGFEAGIELVKKDIAYRIRKAAL